jgi:hypothetical protein
LKAELRATEKKQEDLVAAAREKIEPAKKPGGNSRSLHRLLVQTYEGYLRADQRACLGSAGESASEVRRDGQGDRGSSGMRRRRS